MKKYFAFVTMLFAALIMISTGVSAAENVCFSLKTDENIKPGQSFNLYLSADSSTDIGVFRISVEFDDEVLTFKSARLSDEYKNYDMRYENHGNRIIIIYMNDTQSSSKSLKDFIKLRFSPLNNDSESCIFKTSLYETGDINAEPLECIEMPSLSLKVTQNGSSTDTSYSKVTSKPQGEIPKNKTSSINTDSSEKSKNPEISDNTLSAQYSLTENHEYSLSENVSDISFKQDYFYFIAGAVILVAVVAIVAFKLGAKNKYYNSDDKNKK
ncbi:MAG: cohesin domain-containing protein [Acutalibacteraceae bacterium]